ENIIENSLRGITAINVAEHLICSHSFIAYVDKNLVIRDSFICDFKIELPEIILEESELSVPSSLSKDYDIDILKYNLMPSFVIHVLKSILMAKKIVILSDDAYISKFQIVFFKYITEESFDDELITLTKDDYKKNKKDYKDYIVIDGNEIIQDKDKIINLKKLDVESTIVQKYFAEYDPEVSLIILKNEMSKIFQFSEGIIKFNKRFNENNKYTMKQVLEYFEVEYMIQIQYPYLVFLEEVAANYFKVDLHKADTATNIMELI
ncbi:unnamed protein product, partial [marine sediment metagenome]